MYTCNKCKSKNIKTRLNKSYGKSKTTVVGCKDCGSTDIMKLDYKKDKRRR